LGIAYPATNETKQNDMMNVGFQLDGNSKGDAFTCVVDAMRFSGW